MPGLKSYDALIVGMGPAGSTAAYELSRGGLAVLGLEKKSHPRYKVCGGGLSARIDHILDPDYKTVVEHTIYGVQFAYRGEDPFFIESSRPIAYMVMRDRFDHLLVEKARQAGAEVHEGEDVVELIEGPDGLEVITNRERYRASVVIGADGANSVVARRLFRDWRHQGMPTLESELQIGQAPVYPGEGKVLIDLGTIHSGYAWVFPKTARLSIGVAEFRNRSASPREMFNRFIHEEKALANMTVPRPVGHPLPLFRANGLAGGSTLVRHRTVLVGDAGHLVDPLFGEGIYYAIRSSQMAAESILRFFQNPQRTLQDYQMAVGRELYPEFRIASRIARIVYAFPRLCHKVLYRYQEVINLYYEVLRGKETYQSFFQKAKDVVKASFRELLREAFPFR